MAARGRFGKSCCDVISSIWLGWLAWLEWFENAANLVDVADASDAGDSSHASDGRESAAARRRARWGGPVRGTAFHAAIVATNSERTLALEMLRGFKRLKSFGNRIFFTKSVRQMPLPRDRTFISDSLVALLSPALEPDFLRVGIVRFQSQGLLELGDRLSELPLLGNCNAEVAVDLGEIEDRLPRPFRTGLSPRPPFPFSKSAKPRSMWGRSKLGFDFPRPFETGPVPPRPPVPFEKELNRGCSALRPFWDRYPEPLGIER